MNLGTLLDNMKQLESLNVELKRIQASIRTYQAGHQAPNPDDLRQEVEITELIKKLRETPVQ